MNRCDLCGHREVSWLWWTPNTITREQADAGEGFFFEDEGWYICDPCHQHILIDNPTGLLMRAISNMEPTFEEAFDHPYLQEAIKEARRRAIAHTHSSFWANKTTYERIEE